MSQPSQGRRVVCEGCGAPLPVMMTGSSVRCAHCGAENMVGPQPAAVPDEQMVPRMVMENGQLVPYMVHGPDGPQPEMVREVRIGDRPKDADAQRRAALASTQLRLDGLHSPQWGVSIVLAAIVAGVSAALGGTVGAAVGLPMPLALGLGAAAGGVMTLVALQLRRRRHMASPEHGAEVREVEQRLVELQAQVARDGSSPR